MKMIQFSKIYIIALIAIVYSIEKASAKREGFFVKRAASENCRRAYIQARTTEKICFMDITSLDQFGNNLKTMCSNVGCIKKTLIAYNKFNSSCNDKEVRNKAMLRQHIKALDEILCKKESSNGEYCVNKINTFIKSNPSSKKDLGICEDNCISSSFNIIGKGIVSVPNFLRNSIIRANLLCSKVPGKRKYCIDKLEDFRKEKSYEKKMNIYCNSLCVQKVLWKEQSEYPLVYDLKSSVESIIANFTDSACLYYNDNRCGEFLLKILNNDYGCSGLRYPRVFPFSGNYTLCNNEIKQIISEYGTCVNALFSNKSGDWLNLFKEISRYSKTRRLKNYEIFSETLEDPDTFNRTYKIDNFNWDWYRSNDRAVSVYIINSIAAHLGITPSMISGQGYNGYDISIKGLTNKQKKELDNDHTMSLTMFSGKISVEALNKTDQGFTIDGARTNLPNMITIFVFVAGLFYLFF